MDVVLRVERNSLMIFEYEFRVKEPGDLERGGAEALLEFRKQRSDISLFDEDVWVKFEKASSDADRT